MTGTMTSATSNGKDNQGRTDEKSSFANGNGVYMNAHGRPNANGTRTTTRTRTTVGTSLASSTDPLYLSVGPLLLTIDEVGVTNQYGKSRTTVRIHFPLI